MQKIQSWMWIWIKLTSNKVNVFIFSWAYSLPQAVWCLMAHLCPTHWDPMRCSRPGSLGHGDSPGKDPGVGCHFLLQGIFPTQGSNPGLLHCRQILYHRNHQGNPSYSKGHLPVFFINLYLSKHLFILSHYLPHLSTNHFPCELQSSPLCFHNHTRQ